MDNTLDVSRSDILPQATTMKEIIEKKPNQPIKKSISQNNNSNSIIKSCRM